MRVKDRRCLIQLDEGESELWHAFGMLLDELVAEVRNETEDEVIYQLLEEMKFRYEDVDEKSIKLFDLRGWQQPLPHVIIRYNQKKERKW